MICVSVYGYTDCCDYSLEFAQACIPAGQYIPNEDGFVLYLSASYTLWASRETGLAIANGAFSPNMSVPSRNTTYPQWKLRSGFKVAAGAFFGTDGWEILLQYTWFYNLHNHMRVNQWTNEPGHQSFQLPALQYMGTDLFRSSNAWSMQFNRIDFFLSRTFFAGTCVLISPFVGFLSWWDFQKLEATYQVQDTTLPIQTTCAQEYQNAWGTGPYIGDVVEFCVYNDEFYQVGFYGQLGVSLPWSTYHTKVKNQMACDSSIDSNQTSVQNLYSINRQELTTFMVEVILGFRFIVWFNDCCSFMLQIAWENQLYRNHNHMYIPMSAPQGLGSQEFILQGLTVTLAFGF